MEWPLPRLQLMGWVCEIMTAVRSAEPAGGLPQQRQRLQLSWRHPRGLPGTQFRSASSPCRGADGHTRNSRPRGPSQIPPGPAVLMTLPHWVGHVGRAGLDAPRPRGARPSISCHTQAASLWAAFFNLPNSHLGLGLFLSFTPGGSILCTSLEQLHRDLRGVSGTNILGGRVSVDPSEEGEAGRRKTSVGWGLLP